jgi:hypothetical protein
MPQAAPANMPYLTGEVRNDAGAVMLRAVTVDAGSIAAANSLDVVMTVADAMITDIAYVTTDASVAFNAGLGISHAWVNAAGQVTVRLLNLTAGAIDPASRSFMVMLFRR